MRGPISLKSNTCTEGVDVYAAGISVKAGAHYPGRPLVVLTEATVAARHREATRGVSRGHISPLRSRVKGQTSRRRWDPKP